MNVYIGKINAHGTSTSKLDFLAGRKCKALGEPIKEGRLTSEQIRLVASRGPSNTCGDMTLVFSKGSAKFLEGRTESQQGAGTPFWLDAPNKWFSYATRQ